MNKMDSVDDTILKSLDKVLNFSGQKIPVFFNRDPRGYALKIQDDYIREIREDGKSIHTDMGGYGIIAPEINQP